MKSFIIWILLGGSATAETCADHLKMVVANHLLRNWRVIGQTVDDDFASITLKQYEGDSVYISSFVYTSNKLLIAEAGMRGYQDLEATCEQDGKPTSIFWYSVKRKVKV